MTSPAPSTNFSDFSSSSASEALLSEGAGACHCGTFHFSASARIVAASSARHTPTATCRNSRRAVQIVPEGRGWASESTVGPVGGRVT